MTPRTRVLTLVVLLVLVALGYWLLGVVFSVHGLSQGGSDEGAPALVRRAAGLRPA